MVEQEHRLWEAEGQDVKSLDVRCYYECEAEALCSEHNAAVNALHAALDEIKRLKENVGCARHQGSTQYCAELEPIRKERDELREKLKEQAIRHSNELSSLERRLSGDPDYGPDATPTVPCTVSFDCTPEELHMAFLAHIDEMSRHYNALHQKPTDFAYNYLATRARVTVPEGVPTAKELRNDWLRTGSQLGFEYCLDRLAPYLNQPQKYLRCIFCNHIEDTVEGLREHSAACTAHPKHEALMAAEAECDNLREELDSDEALAVAYENGMRAARAIDIRPTGEGELTYYLNGKRFVPEPEPIASPEVLEELAEIAQESYSWRGKGEDEWTPVVSAVLHAAQPFVDASWRDINQRWTSDKETPLEDEQWLDSRIRYRIKEAPNNDHVLVLPDGSCVWGEEESITALRDKLNRLVYGFEPKEFPIEAAIEGLSLCKSASDWYKYINLILHIRKED